MRRRVAAGIRDLGSVMATSASAVDAQQNVSWAMEGIRGIDKGTVAMVMLE